MKTIEGKFTTLPSFCPNCKHQLSRTPTWLSILEAMSPGTGNKEMAYTKSAIAKAANIHRQQLDPDFGNLVKQGLVEPADGVAGAKVYRKTHYGSVVLSRWRAVGWKSNKQGGK